VPNDEQDKAGVLAPPPLIYLGVLLFGLLLGRRFPRAVRKKDDPLCEPRR
jgi:hypothetical protein